MQIFIQSLTGRSAIRRLKKPAYALKTPHVVFQPVLAVVLLSPSLTGPLTVVLKSQQIVPMNIL